ncbi:hypothetical protein H4Q26_002632 [Puccinia striiformis f. sp. tritici PST-130]|nr:hypothetical protein H4Q26_002632 [Puccinia striiformis f. sp. tritici PST-130]
MSGQIQISIPTKVYITDRHLQPIDLFTEITADLLRRINRYKELVKAHEENPSKHPKPTKKQIILRNPRDNKNLAALKQVQDMFAKINHG